MSYETVEVLDRSTGALVETLSVIAAAERIRGWDFAPLGWHEKQLAAGREFASAGFVYRPRK